MQKKPKPIFRKHANALKRKRDIYAPSIFSFVLGKQPKYFPVPTVAFKKIVELFIAPLWSIPSLEPLNESERLEVLFNHMGRDIVPAYSKFEFAMPGKVYSMGDFRRPLWTEQKIKKGQPLLVRLDVAMPERIDIEKVDTGTVFVLNSAEYEQVYPLLEAIKKDNKRLVPVTKKVR
jgi:hypothetical protein